MRSLYIAILRHSRLDSRLCRNDTGRHRKHLTRTPKKSHCTLTILRKSVYHVLEHLFTVSLVRIEEETLALREEVERGGDLGALAAEHTTPYLRLPLCLKEVRS